MKAHTQYDDYVGTSAAECNNNKMFAEFCQDCSIDLEQFLPIGFRFHNSYDHFDFYILCLNKKEDDKQVEIKIKCSPNQFFRLFRSLDVVAYESRYNERFEEQPVNDEFSLDANC